MKLAFLILFALLAVPQFNVVRAQTDRYSCPMHPDVVSTRPGKCPKCGMTLVKRAAAPDPAAAQLAGSGGVDAAVASVSLSPEQRITANVKTLRVTPATHTAELVTVARRDPLGRVRDREVRSSGAHESSCL